jgi:hypothetical protein
VSPSTGAAGAFRRRRAAGLALSAMLALCSAAAGAADPAPAAAAEFAAGRTALAQAQAEVQAARQALLEASRMRQALLARRGSRPDAKPAATGGEDPAAALERLQQEGAESRARGDAALQRALSHFSAGMLAGWGPWVHNRAPLTLDDGLHRFIGHNASVRSVHPNMPDLPAAAAASAADNGFSLRFPMMASQNPPQDLDIGAFQLSREQRYLAHIEVQGDGEAGGNAGNAAAVPLNRMHRWRLLVSDLDGVPVQGATILVAGHMPGHVHGLPTQPRVTQELAPGVYLVEGLKFQMEGWWVMQFQIQPRDDRARPDNVAFNLVFE